MIKRSPKIKLDTHFWRAFAQKYWERKSFLAKNVASPLLQMDAAEIFKLLVRFANQCRKAKDAEGFKFYIGGEKVHELQVLKLLPLASDGSLLGYHRRMEARFEDYCLVCDELLQVTDKKDLLTSFTKDLYTHVGFPNRFAEIGLYLGNYRKTPFGVHVDGCGVFSFPIAGTKTFRIWPKSYDRQRPKKGSFTIDAAPGDMTYWPSTAWHIAESDGAFSATWSLGVWVNQAFKHDLATIVSDVLVQALGSTIAESGSVKIKNLHAADGLVDELPALYAEALHALKNISTDDLQDAFLKKWLTHISKQGLKVIPPAQKPAAVKNGQTLRLKNLRTPILWLRSARNGNLIFSCNGLSAETPYSAELLQQVKKLNVGSSIKVTPTFPAGLRSFASAGAFAASKGN